jgi:YD repeat-containing protein
MTGTFAAANGNAVVVLESAASVVPITLKIIEIESLARYQFDSVGNMVASTDRLENTTRYEYDKLNRRTKTLEPTTDSKQTESITETVFDKAGNVWKQISPYGYATENVYNQFGDIVKRIQTEERLDLADPPRQLITLFNYDDFGRLTEVIGHGGDTTAHKYDAYGRRIETTDALGNVTKFEYDKKNRVVAEIDAAGNRTTYQYNLSTGLQKLGAEWGGE